MSPDTDNDERERRETVPDSLVDLDPIREYIAEQYGVTPADVFLKRLEPGVEVVFTLGPGADAGPITADPDSYRVHLEETDE